MSEVYVNSQGRRTIKTSSRVCLWIGQQEAIADVNHCIDADLASVQLIPQPVNVNMQTLHVDRLIAAPGVFPKLFGRDNPFRRTRQTRKDQELCARQLKRLTATGNVIV